MSLLDSFKKSAAQAQFETDKLLRINRVQGQISTSKGQIRQKLYQLGEGAMRLYREGKLSDPTLVEICEAIVSLENEISENEARIEQIKEEVFKVVLPPAASTGRRACPHCGEDLPSEAIFCPECGGNVRGGLRPETQPATVRSSKVCLGCLTPLADDAIFCPECGKKVETV